MKNITEIMYEGEHQTLGFKPEIDDQKKIAQLFSAFSNTDGGRLLVGVRHNLKIIGCDPEQEILLAKAAAELYCQPPITLEHQIHVEGYRKVLEIFIPKSTGKKVMAYDDQDNLKYYFRNFEQTRTVGKILYRVWKQNESPQVKSKSLGEVEKQLLSEISHEGLSLSQLYKFSELDKRVIDHWLVMFICWNLVKIAYTPTSTLYKLVD